MMETSSLGDVAGLGFSLLPPSRGKIGMGVECLKLTLFLF